MNDREKPPQGTHPQNHKTILVVRMVRIKEQPPFGVIENATSLFKPNAMLGPILLILIFIPFKA